MKAFLWLVCLLKKNNRKTETLHERAVIKCTIFFLYPEKEVIPGNFNFILQRTAAISDGTVCKSKLIITVMPRLSPLQLAEINFQSISKHHISQRTKTKWDVVKSTSGNSPWSSGIQFRKINIQGCVALCSNSNQVWTGWHTQVDVTRRFVDYVFLSIDILAVAVLFFLQPVVTQETWQRRVSGLSITREPGPEAEPASLSVLL